MTKPHYPHESVQHIESLRRPLGVSLGQLRRLARNASNLYIAVKPLKKKDGTLRPVYDTQKPLKFVLQRINACFLKKVIYPDYLTGGLPGTDYVEGADAHKNAAFAIKEDITKFFNNIDRSIVNDIWRKFFGFSEEVSELLTDLTTRDGYLEQGAPTSGYLANLALWDIEPSIVARLKERGFNGYSRHVDDITISSDKIDCLKDRAWAIQQVNGMLLRKGLKRNRKKHEFLPGNKRITVLNLVANKKPSLPAEEQSRIRAVVHQYCKSVDEGGDTATLLKDLPKVRGQAGKLKRLHKDKGDKLLKQISAAALKLRERQSSSGPGCQAVSS